jgi:hypothetical protein
MRNSSGVIGRSSVFCEPWDQLCYEIVVYDQVLMQHLYQFAEQLRVILCMFRGALYVAVTARLKDNHYGIGD